MQQKAALARKEAEAAKLETAKALLQVKSASTSEPVKQVSNSFYSWHIIKMIRHTSVAAERQAYFFGGLNHHNE